MGRVSSNSPLDRNTVYLYTGVKLSFVKNSDLASHVPLVNILTTLNAFSENWYIGLILWRSLSMK